MSEIKPALSAEEWATAALITGEYCDSLYELAPSGPTPNKLHAIAALALYGQSFGFTWGDVDALKDGITGCDFEGWGDSAGVLRSLADRIAALLPPRDVVPKEPA